MAITDQIADAVTRAVACAPLGRLFAFVPPARRYVDGKRLDAQTGYLLRLMALAGPGSIASLAPEAARAEYARSGIAVAPAARALARVEDVSVPGPAGAIPARLYIPFARAAALPALVYFHGGGWVLGDLATHDRLCRVLAADAGCVVVAIDYRLAPENKFPAAVDDALAAFTWIASEARAFGIDPDRISVGGDSAGGNLAAVVSQTSAAERAPRVAYQLLIYPVTDLGCDTRSYDLYGDGYFLTREIMLWFRSHYLRELGDVDDPRVSPLRADLRSPLAPALVITAGFDPLLDEGAAYARKLRSVGTEVIYRCHDSLIHGFASITGAVPVARSALQEITTAMRLAFARL
jgi:acetyl esterase